MKVIVKCLMFAVAVPQMRLIKVREIESRMLCACSSAGRPSDPLMSGLQATYIAGRHRALSTALLCNGTLIEMEQLNAELNSED